MRYASAATAERRNAALARKAEKAIKNLRDKCIKTLETLQLNRRVLIRKRLTGFRSAPLLRRSCPTHAQPHHKIDNDCRRNRQEKRPNESRPKCRPNDS